MASPVGHSLAATIIYIASRREPGGTQQELWWLILAANLADLDLVPSLLMGDHSLFHRTFSHSVFASILFAAIVYTTCWRRHPEPGYTTMLMFGAYLSQLLIDWLSYDPGPIAGIPVLWPLSDQRYMADPTVFLNIERNNLLSREVITHNIKAVLLEIIILAPPAALLWWWKLGRARQGKEGSR